MSRLEIRLLGGFEVWYDDQPVTGFESQKVRALLAYLMVNRQTAYSRDRLSGLFWPDKDEETARRNLRQAIYNLRSILPRSDSSESLLLVTHKSLQVNPKSEYWLDVAAFEEAVRRGMTAAGPQGLAALAEAVELYGGDFLAGFFLKGSPEFEHWLFYEQERLREMAVQTLRRLIDHHLTAGAYRLGIRYARRLLEIDPLSEEAHRKLMRLYVLSGRRARAVTQYEEYRALLRSELGIEPLEETTALYRAILARKWPVPSRSDAETTLPVVPFTGRATAYAALRRTWREVAPGSGRVTFVAGEAGVGKTRLVEEFLRTIQEQPPAVVLRGCAYRFAPQVGYGPIAQALRDAAVNHPALMPLVFARLPEVWVAHVARIVPELRALRPQLIPPDPRVGQEVREPFYEAVARFLEALTEVGEEQSHPRKLILLLEDLHWADQATLALFEYLIQRLASAPIWLLGTYRPEALDEAHPLHALVQRLDDEPRAAHVMLQRFRRPTVARIAAEVVDGDQTAALAAFLYRNSGGLPLALIESLNYLADRGALTPSDAGGWTLREEHPVEGIPKPESLHDLIMWRVSRLPASARRLLTLAAVMGPVFEVGLLSEIDGEQKIVVDAGVETWLRRGMVREWSEEPVPLRWVPDATGNGDQPRYLAFAHDEIRQAIYSDVNVRRRQLMHRQVAETLERRWAGKTHLVCELIAHHYAAARVWPAALPYLQQAGRKAHQALDFEAAVRYYGRALEVLEGLESGAMTASERQRWLRQRLEVLTERVEACTAVGMLQQRDADARAMQEIAAELERFGHRSPEDSQVEEGEG